MGVGRVGAGLPDFEMYVDKRQVPVAEWGTNTARVARVNGISQAATAPAFHRPISRAGGGALGPPSISSLGGFA